MKKQDRQGVRKASDIEQKYDLGMIAQAKKYDNAQVNKLTQDLSNFIVSTNNELANLKQTIEDTVIPIASADTLGGVKIGENISIAEDGTISVSSSPSGDASLEEIEASVEALETSLAELNDSVTECKTRDYVIETGKSGIWHYRKWNSGHLELWASTWVTCAVNVAMGYVYRSDVQYISLPFTIYNSSCQITMLDHNTWCSSAWVGETASSIPVVVWRGTTFSSYNWNLKLYVIGRWKQ